MRPACPIALKVRGVEEADVSLATESDLDDIDRAHVEVVVEELHGRLS
jgi:hypothetical protein